MRMVGLSKTMLLAVRRGEAMIASPSNAVMVSSFSSFLMWRQVRGGKDQLILVESSEGLPNRPANVQEPPMECSAILSRQALISAAHGWRAVRPVVKLGGGTSQQETPPDNIFELVQD
jgi:hypothetical protein